MPVGGTSQKTVAKAPVPIRQRLKAWWHGEPAAAVATANAPSNGNREPPGIPEVPKQRWVHERIEIAQSVWGEGMIRPGLEEFVAGLLAPLGLDPAMNVVNMGAGLGGVDRMMVDKFGVWVTGLEADEDLVKESNGISSRAGMDRKAPVDHFDPDSHRFKPKSIDCIFAMNLFYGVRSKDDLLEEIARGLKPGGQLLFTDFLLADGYKADQVADWAKKDTVVPRLWRLSDYEHRCEELRLDLRVKEDITRNYCNMIAKCWADVIPNIKSQCGTKLYGVILLDELEYWCRLYNALKGGKLRVYRFHAIKAKTEKMLSDW